MEELEQKNKYYVPEITEFRDGFEHEFDQFKTNNFSKTESGSPELVEYWIKENRVRVKFLDSEDIEELGWRFYIGRSDNTRMLFKIISNDTREPNNNYSLLYVTLINHVLIYKSSFNKGYTEEGQTIFEGTIKNKNELKVLMKQLGISESNYK